MNALTTREGLTVIYRLGGPFDVTLEAVVQGGVYALLAIALFAVARLYSAAVDPDDLLRAVRRLSFSSALTAALATRMVPVLARDARRLERRAARAGRASRPRGSCWCARSRRGRWTARSTSPPRWRRAATGRAAARRRCGGRGPATTSPSALSAVALFVARRRRAPAGAVRRLPDASTGPGRRAASC